MISKHWHGSRVRSLFRAFSRIHGHASRLWGLALQVQEGLNRDPHGNASCAIVFVERRRTVL
jgi:hypothetical protein